MTSTVAPQAPTPPAQADASQLLAAFVGLQVVVVGDVILDAYVDGHASRLSREAPVPVVCADESSDTAGGAANVAVSLAALGADVRLLSVVGRDEAADRLLGIAARQGVDVGGVVATSRRATVAKRRVLAEGHMLVRVDEGTLVPIAAPLEGKLSALLSQQVADADALVVADYGNGVMTDGLVASLPPSRRGRGVPVVVDSKDPRRYRAVRPLACTPNFEEAAAALGGVACADRDRARAVAAAAGRMLDLSAAEIVAVTLDRDGAVLLERGRAPHRVYTHAMRERCSAGAGDTFTAAFTLGLAARGDAAAAAEVAAAAAAVVVAKPGTATCSAAELRLRLRPGGKVLPDAGRLAVEGDRYRGEGRRIVFTNGCFDILHRGHVTLLNRAKELGDVLVVAVNGDASVQRLKGDGRPINSLADRTEVLAALSCVDHLVPFDSDRPEELLRALRPDVVVKGGDYTPDTLPETALVRALGAELRILEAVPECSTTRIVERLRPVAS
jgi:D-beta-D-heptose 7-phosphate kinase/D-beta-D-heptose 1-phosphate adenosyltransferase